MSYGVDVRSDGAVLVYRVSRGGIVTGEKVRVGADPVEVRVLRGRDYYEARAGCEWFLSSLFSRVNRRDIIGRSRTGKR